MHRLRGTGLLFAAIAAVWLSAEGSAHAGMIYSRGHGDIGVLFEDGEFELHYHFDSSSLKEDGSGGFEQIVPTPTSEDEFSPAEFFIRVPDPAVARPAGSQWDFIGTPAGADIWFLPQSNTSNKPFLGIASEDLDIGDWIGGITWALTGVTLPAGGEFALWQSDFGGNPNRFWDTQDGSFVNDVFSTSVGGHDHFNYGFTTTGVYELQITATGNHRTFGTVSDTETFTFLVGDSTQAPTPAAVPEPSSLILLGMASVMGIGGRAWRKKRRAAPQT